ncbi:hypothetical protein [Burkholderia ubonensis]|uniref:hypothetical protein n=1 Tax=Burkholderia ubonensis TaxID=101571 RepID=UPI000A58926E|nr:hypothetical protein [Burkholderia ubonensis]
MPAQIAWPHLPRFSAKLEGVCAALEFAPRVNELILDEKAKDELARFSLGVLCLPTNAPVGEGTPMQWYRRSVAELTRKGWGSNEGTAFELSARIVARLEASPCAVCSPENACRGTADHSFEDEQRVSARGYCLAPVRDLFDISTRLARHYYSYSRSVLPNVQLATGHLGARNSESECAFSAASSEASEYDVPFRLVKIAFHVDSFGWDDYRKLLYGIFHECFVHAFCGVRLDSREAKASERFHEGWMDHVAWQVLRSSLTGPREMLSSLVAADALAFRDAADHCHARRIDYGRPDAPRSTVQNSVGAQAAAGFFTFSKILLGEGESNKTAVRFSAEVNGSNMSDADRGRLCARASVLFGDETALREALERRDLCTALLAYSKGGDVAPVVAEIIK